jgi:putative thioredoxin
MNDQINKREENSHIFDISEDSFQTKVIEASDKQIILVDFWAPWCEPCKQLSPLLEEIIKECNGLASLAKINIDENKRLASQLRIQSIPTVIAFKNKQIVNGFQDVIPKQKIIEFIEKILGSPLKKDNSEFYQTIENLLEEKNYDEAKNLIEDFLSENSEDRKTISLYILCQMELNQFQELNTFIDSLSDEVLQEKLVQSAIKNYEMVKKSSTNESIDTLLKLYKKNPKNLNNILKLSNKYFVEKKTEEALDLLFNNYVKFKEKEKIKKAILNYFELLGNNNEITKNYRRKLSSILFS